MYILEEYDALIFRIESYGGYKLLSHVDGFLSVAILVAAVNIQITSPEEVTTSLNKIRNKVYERQ